MIRKMQEYRKKANIQYQRNPKAEVFDAVSLTNRLLSDNQNQNIKSIPLKLSIKKTISHNSQIIPRSQKSVPSPDITSNRFPIALGRVHPHSTAVREIEDGFARRPLATTLQNSGNPRLSNKKGVSKPVRI